MLRERQKSMISKRPKEPSLIVWLMAGVMGLLSGILLFWLHMHQLLGPLQVDNIHHALSVTPLLIWLILLCLRSWLYYMAFYRYWSEFDEAKYRQKRGSD